MRRSTQISFLLAQNFDRPIHPKVGWSLNLKTSSEGKLTFKHLLKSLPWGYTLPWNFWTEEKVFYFLIVVLCCYTKINTLFPGEIFTDSAANA